MVAQKFIQYVKTHTYKQFQTDIQNAKNKLLELCQQAEKLQKQISSMELSWMDSVFRPDNQKRKNTVLQLLKKIIKKSFVLGDYLKQTIPKLTEKDYNKMRQVCHTTFCMKTVQKLWKTAGIAFGLFLSVLAFLAGGPIGGAIAITLWFGGVGLILQGLAVHERYTKLEYLITELTPIEQKISEAYAAFKENN